jgi:hypothetical protein
MCQWTWKWAQRRNGLVTASAEQQHDDSRSRRDDQQSAGQNLPYAFRDSLNFAVLIAGNARHQRTEQHLQWSAQCVNNIIDRMNNNSQRFKAAAPASSRSPGAD